MCGCMVLVSSPTGTVRPSTGGEAAPSPDLVTHVVPREDQLHLGRHLLHGSPGGPLALLGLHYEEPSAVEVEGGEDGTAGVDSSHHVHGRYLRLHVIRSEYLKFIFLINIVNTQ